LIVLEEIPVGATGRDLLSYGSTFKILLTKQIISSNLRQNYLISSKMTFISVELEISVRVSRLSRGWVSVRKLRHIAVVQAGKYSRNESRRAGP
jgi:hypothetical protein